MTFKKAVFLFATMATATLCAQTFRGEIKGTVEDSSGAVIAGAIVKATHQGTASTRAGLTGTAGEFSMPDLPLGMYEVAVSKDGFQAQKTIVEVVVSRVSTISFRLPVATQAATVEVNAEIAAVETASTTLTGVVNT